jgi:putative DNA primase/helicase
VPPTRDTGIPPTFGSGVDVMRHAITLPTDTDQGLLLIERFGVALRYVSGIGWLNWDGQRWVNDDHLVREKTKRATRERIATVLSAGNMELLKKSMRLEDASHISGTMRSAESDPRVLTTVDQLDADPWLFNCLNGTVDLRTGMLHPHDPDQVITKLAPVNYVPGARHPALDHILATLDGQMPGLAGLLQRVFGMCLSGDATAEVLILIQGEGGAGKTTLSEAFLTMIGDYGVKLPFETLCLNQRGRQSGAAQPDLVRLRGARFAYASEGDEASRLDAGVVKMLTGNEKVSCRALHKDPIEFPQTWKLALVSNYEPNCSGDDSGLWRRIVKIGFQAIPEHARDVGIKEKLVHDPAAREAFLAWAVEGCKAWVAGGRGRKGLAIPQAIDTMTEEYRQRQDVLAQWWADTKDIQLWLNPNGRVPVAEVRQMYVNWAKSQGMPELGAKRFNAFLEKHRLKSGTCRLNGTVVKAWSGISTDRPLPTEEAAAATVGPVAP